MNDRNLDPLEKAVINLLNSKQGIFYASLILMMKRIPMEIKQGAMGVGFENGQVRLVYDPDWVGKMTVQQIMFCLEHECLHLVLDHLVRMGDRDPMLWNLAADCAVNGYIMDDPGPCVEPYDIVIPGRGPFSDLPKGKHAEWYYDKIMDKAEKYTVTKNSDGSITVKNEKTGKSQTYKPNSHDEWETMGQGDESLNKEVVKVMVKEAYQEAKNRGSAPGGAVAELIEKLLEQNTVNWKALLRRYCAASILSQDRKSSWKRTSRRFNEEYPGYVRVRQPKIVAHFDTSGSMGDEELMECASELKSLQKIYNATITIIECDAAINKTYDLSKFTKIQTNFHGRGGTSHKPIWEFLKDKKVDLLISFTDMCSDISASDKPRYQVVWVTPSVMQGQKVDPPFGRHVQVTKK